MTEKKYFTTPIYYVNDVPHIGHAYCTLATDTLARYWRKKIGPENVRFMTGTDENSQKTVDAAAKNGKEIYTYLDEMAGNWKKTWKKCGLQFDDFIRTTEDRHHEKVKELFERIYEQGDIYKGSYRGLYCTGCETFYKESELDVNGHCPAHKKPPTELEEENYFFRLSKYEKPLLEYYEKNPAFLIPEKRKNEILSFIKSGLEDISVSRETAEFGISLPMDEKHKVYVWFDALINYLSGLPNGEENTFWSEADVCHVVGKDITRFHCVIWPAMLLSAGIKLPEQVFAHGFFTVDGEKMSKSLGNVISPRELSDQYGNDALRIGLLSSFEFGNDGDFSLDRFHDFYDSHLVGGVGNLFNRVVTLVQKFLEGRNPPVNQREAFYGEILSRYTEKFENYELRGAIEVLLETVDDANKLLNETEVWKLAKTDLDKASEIFSFLVQYLELVAHMSETLLPETAQKMWDMLGDGTTLGPAEILFPRVDQKIVEVVEAPRKTIQFTVNPKLIDTGYNIKAALITIPKISRKQSKAFRAYLAEALEQMDFEALLQSEIIEVANKSYLDAGVTGKHPATHLLEILQKSGKLPNINNVVDCYNLSSVKHQISFGVHDLDKINGDVKLDFTTGDEAYLPLGGKELVRVNGGEYAFMDTNRILCRMDCKQCDETKITDKGKHLLIYAQGNKAVDIEYLEKSLQEVLTNLVEFCGGEDVEGLI